MAFKAPMTKARKVAESNPELYGPESLLKRGLREDLRLQENRITQAMEEGQHRPIPDIRAAMAALKNAWEMCK